jgi:hypothetical protein
MGNKENHTPNTQKRVTPKAGVKIVIRPEFTGNLSITEAFIPVIFEDIRASIDRHTFDNKAVGQ